MLLVSVKKQFLCNDDAGLNLGRRSRRSGRCSHDPALRACTTYETAAAMAASSFLDSLVGPLSKEGMTQKAMANIGGTLAIASRRPDTVRMTIQIVERVVTDIFACSDNIRPRWMLDLTVSTDSVRASPSKRAEITGDRITGTMRHLVATLDQCLNLGVRECSIYKKLRLDSLQQARVFPKTTQPYTGKNPPWR